MAGDDTPPPNPPPTSADKIIPFSITNKVLIRLDLEKHNYRSRSSFFIIHLGSLCLKSHVEEEASSSTTNLEWCKLDDLIKMWILGSLLKNLGCVVSDKNLVIYAVNGLDSRFATLVEIIRHREPLSTFEIAGNMILLKESSMNDQSGASTTFESSSSSPTILVATNSSNNKGDLYLVTKSSTIPSAFVSTSSSTWYQRLSHPGDEVLRSLALRHFISCNKESLISEPLPYPMQPKTTNTTTQSTQNTQPVNQTHNAPSTPHHSSPTTQAQNPTPTPLTPQPTNSPSGQPPQTVNEPPQTHRMHKFHAGGTLSRYKARLVANDSSQQLGVDFDETFSSVVKPATIRTVLSLVVSRKWSIHQLDVKNAFLNGDLSKTVYMHRPLDLLTLDDIILTASSPALLQQIIDSLHRLFLSQRKYALQLFERAHMVNCNPSRTPVDTESKLSPKAEYRGVANVVAETAWLRNLLRELRSPLLTVTVFYCDNVSAIYMSANPVQHQRTKHIEIDIHFVRDMVTAGQVRVLHVPSRYQYADIFTRGLPSTLFEEFRSSLSIQHSPTPTRGAY
nr:NBS-containing resistance-like protein [Tanacetum cinerariifolium]